MVQVIISLPYLDLQGQGRTGQGTWIRKNSDDDRKYLVSISSVLGTVNSLTPHDDPRPMFPLFTDEEIRV